MVSLEITAAENESGKITPEHLASAVQTLDADGAVVLRNVVQVEHLTVLREKMLEDLEGILVRPDAPFNFNTGNVQQDPPPVAPYLFRDVLLNDIVIAVTHAVLGNGVKNDFYSGNTALPGGERQPVHPDVGQLWDNLKYPTPAFALVVNIPVVDVSAENGATEIWLGTHHDPTYSIHKGSARIPEDKLAPYRASRPPIQPTVPLGSVVIRDIRLWHAGMPNHTDVPRPMIAMVHSCGWWKTGDGIAFPRAAESFLKHDVLETVAHYSDGVPDYLHHNAAHDVQK